MFPVALELQSLQGFFARHEGRGKLLLPLDLIFPQSSTTAGYGNKPPDQLGSASELSRFQSKWFCTAEDPAGLVRHIVFCVGRWLSHPHVYRKELATVASLFTRLTKGTFGPRLGDVPPAFGEQPFVAGRMVDEADLGHWLHIWRSREAEKNASTRFNPLCRRIVRGWIEGLHLLFLRMGLLLRNEQKKLGERSKSVVHRRADLSNDFPDLRAIAAHFSCSSKTSHGQLESETGMALYHEAASLLIQTSSDGERDSLKSRIYGRRDLKSLPAQLYALISETTKWSPILSEVVGNSDILRHERKLTSPLALLLAHDLLLSRSGVALPQSHPLRSSIQRHRTRLTAEFTKLRVKKGFGSIESFKQAVNDGQFSAQPPSAAGLAPNGSWDASRESRQASNPHPRWVRVNTLKTSLSDQLEETFGSYTEAPDLASVMSASPDSKMYCIDQTVPQLMAFPPGTDLTKTPAYTSGALILQDKASCLPPVLLNWHGRPEEGRVVDACAAPGNKTSQLAAISADDEAKACDRGNRLPRVVACERDKFRSHVLKDMLKRAGASNWVDIRQQTDFLSLDPLDAKWRDVGALLLDPSCSGSGIIGRDAESEQRPTQGSLIIPQSSGSQERKKTKKRKRETTTEPNRADLTETTKDSSPTEAEKKLAERLASLSTFQLHALKHAMRFPNAQRIVYSTCSIHVEENEAVILKALQSDIAKERGWKVLRREQQVESIRAWERRGDLAAVDKWSQREACTLNAADGVINACVRCVKGTADGTMGFFMCGFVRESGQSANDQELEEEEEWEGFGDSDP